MQTDRTSFGIAYSLLQNVLFEKAKIPKEIAGLFEDASCGECYICKMVEVFREVRRVLRDDGVLFLNIGDSYASQGGQLTYGSFDGATGRGSAPAQRVGAYGKRDKAPEGSLAHDCFCRSLCGACRAAYRIGKSHSDRSLAAMPSVSSSESIPEHTGSPCDHPPMSGFVRQHDRTSTATPDLELGAVPGCEPLPVALVSTMPQSLPQPQASCLPSEIRDGGCRLCGRSLRRSDPVSAHTVECICDSAPPASADRNLDMDASGLAYQSYTTAALKPKDMVGIPWMLAFALRADGWYLRSDIIWSKPNAMPESVQDRPTKSHEYIFLLTKSPNYFFDYIAIQEPASGTAHARSAAAGEFPGSADRDEHRRRPGVNPKANGPNSRMVKERTPSGATNKPNPSASNVRPKQNPSFSEAVHRLVSTRNKRSVWTVPTAPFSGAHYATFPPNLIRPCILAGTSAKGCCSKCGAPWERVIEKPPLKKTDYEGKYAGSDHRGNNLQKACLTARAQGGDHDNPFPPPKTIGWKQGCACLSSEVVPATVLDPFAGSFVTCMVALEYGRSSIGIELNPESVELGRQRCQITPGLALA